MKIFLSINKFGFQIFSSLFLIGLLFVSPNVFAVKIMGKVVNLETDAPLVSVNIANVHTGEEFTTLANGLFEMEVKKGDLIEFRLPGFDVARVRFKSDNVASYYYIQMKKAPTTIENQLMNDVFTGAKIDSIKRRELYQQALEHYKLTGLDIIQHPFDAMSKRNRMIWAFQKNYEIWEKEKFVDYVFNDRLIVQLTGLDGDNLEEYKRMYRPGYEMIRGLNEYEYYTFIKESVKAYKQRKEQVDNPTRPFNYER